MSKQYYLSISKTPADVLLNKWELVSKGDLVGQLKAGARLVSKNKQIAIRVIPV